MSSKLLSDEFSQDTRVRPYTVGLTEHDRTISTILLYQENDYPEDIDNNQKDYLTDIDTEVNELSLEGIDSVSYGSVVQDPGNLAVIKLDGTNDYYGVFNNFSLLQVIESTNQIKSVHVNFGSSWNAFFFGEEPRVYTFSGYFIDSQEYPFYQEFFVAYEKYLSGRKTIENNMKTKFVYDGKIVDGYILGINVKSTSDNYFLKQFDFSVLVRGVTWARTNVIHSNGKVLFIDGNTIQSTSQQRVLNGMSNSMRHKSFDLTGQPIGSDIVDFTQPINSDMIEGTSGNA